MSKNAWCVYLLRCSDSSLYCGITNNLEKRVFDHNNKLGSKYTRSRLPVVLEWFVESPNRSSASKLEYRIKRLSKKNKENLIDKTSDIFDLFDDIERC